MLQVNIYTLLAGYSGDKWSMLLVDNMLFLSDPQISLKLNALQKSCFCLESTAKPAWTKTRKGRNLTLMGQTLQR